MSEELVVVWNGVNDGRDGDLLNASLRLPAKVEGTASAPVAMPPHRYGDRVALIEALLASTDRPLSIMDVARRIGVARETARWGLGKLRQHQLVDCCEERLPAGGFGRQYVRLYFLKGRFLNGTQERSEGVARAAE